MKWQLQHNVFGSVRTILLCTGMLLGAQQASADTLYASVPSNLAAGHPLRLVSDHRAAQIGDLVAVEFNYAVTTSSAASNNQKKAADINLAGGTGLAGIPFFQFPSAYTSNSGSSSSKAKTDTSSFSTIMMATVTAVLPSGALEINGTQGIIIDGSKQIMHVTGTIRPEDIDNTDMVVSSKIANIQAKFDGDTKSDHHGLVQKVLDVLF